MTILTTEQLQELRNLAEDGDFTVRSYSGRGMIGDTCLGLSTPGSIFSLGLLIGSSALLSRLFQDSSVREETMGKGSVLYFPFIAAPEEE